VTIDRELLEILACPNCRGAVEEREAESVIVCLECGYRYPIRDGIPVMLVDEAEKPPRGKKRK
jgi:hypothetical protein